MALRVAMTHGEFISAGLGVVAKNRRIRLQELCYDGQQTRKFSFVNNILIGVTWLGFVCVRKSWSRL